MQYERLARKQDGHAKHVLRRRTTKYSYKAKSRTGADVFATLGSAKILIPVVCKPIPVTAHKPQIG